MQAQAGSELEFLYFTDPMCSWCYGIGPAVAALEKTYAGRIPLRVIQGGLRPDEEKPMPGRMAREIAGHWHHVEEATGKPFDYSFFNKNPEFVYNTRPANKAVALVADWAPERTLSYQHEIQTRFYAQGEDPTRLETLRNAAGSLGLDPDDFERRFAEPAADELVRGHFEYARSLGVFSYPTLVLRVRDRLGLVSQGYRPLDQLEKITELILEKFYRSAPEPA